MDFDLSPTQKMMQQAARAFLAKQCPARRVRTLMASETACDAALWRSMAEQGWLGIVVEDAQGGLGLSAIELAAIAEEMGRACLPGPFISHVWATALVTASGNREAIARLPAMCEGKSRATVALAEEHPSWDPQAVRMRIESAGADLRLTGRKRLVGDAAESDQLLCTARGAAGELVIARVDRKSPGLRMVETPAIDQTRKLYDVHFEGVLVPQDGVLCRGSAAGAALSQSMQMAALAVSAELVGVMSWVLETSLEYVKTRKQFGKVVGSFQAVQQQCVDMLLWLESARSATYYAAWALASGQEGAAAAVSVAKAYASDAGREVVNRGVQVHGGIGFTWEHDLHLYYKRAKSNEILLGDASFHRARVAELVIDKEAKDLAVAAR